MHNFLKHFLKLLLRNPDILILGGFAATEFVLYNTELNIPFNHLNTYWYKTPSYSFGFSN
jgi:hypothetical protein